MRRGRIRRSYLSDGWQSNPVWGHSWPVYIHLGFQGGPGEIGVRHSHWSSGWGTVSAVGAGRSKEAPLGYSS